MGIYINPGNDGFKTSLRSQIYVDKTGLIEYTNSVLGTRQKYICVSRPRRFGKTMALEMLACYYGMNGNSKEMFKGLEIENSESFEEHLNKYNVLFLNIQRFLSRSKDVEKVKEYCENAVIAELAEEYPNIADIKNTELSNVLEKIYKHTNTGFIFLIDEWDCIFRETKNNLSAQKKYLDFLRDLFKDQPYVKLVYMTGILPVKKYGTHSALNMFDEYSMTDQGELKEFTGFTEKEVLELCQTYDLNFREMQRWYDGYKLEECHIYNPKSVVDSIRRKKFNSYWTSTETYEALRIYLDLNFDGLKDSVIKMLAGEDILIDTKSFQNDMTTFYSKDDVLTLLVHLGYLAYNSETQKVFIPNEEIRGEFITAIKVSDWKEVINAVSASEDLLNALLEGNEEAVAKGVDNVHLDTSSILTYNNENDLSCILTLAFYSARNYYLVIRELPAGKGFADIALIPRPNKNKPAVILELKWNLSAETAIKQIKEKKYVKALEKYTGEIILAGISYSKETKEHSCKIEKIIK